ncbi:hypothetical protein V6N11_050301 [Hibiscus sabdariffa]|uniref:MULE transposase domain-containing protein n=1 Tax=Hibiscus sabdariffa TaxID=183260 RepID=A0ABR2T9D0_9ROSI
MRVDDDLEDNKFDSSDLESLVDERLVFDDDDKEITTLRGQKKIKQKIKRKTVGDEDLQPYLEFNILPMVKNKDVDGEGDENGTDYLDSSDARSYESDSDGEILFKKSSKVFFDASSVEPRFEVGMIFESSQQFKEALYAYVVSQRPVLFLNGCFLKGDFKGELLSFVGIDANNQIFPIAWAVVEVENRETWAWFLKNLRIDLHLINGEKFIVISDMQKASNDVTEIEPITLSSSTQEQHTTEVGRSSQILVSKPYSMKYSTTRAHSPSAPFKSSSMASRPPTSTSLLPTTSAQPPTTVSLPSSTGKFYVLKYKR